MSFVFVTSERARYENIYRARAELSEFNLTEEQLHLSCVPSTAKARQVYMWQTEFFAMHGDVQPNGDNLVQLPGFHTKTGIYNCFRHYVTTTYPGDEHEVASKTLFKSIWKAVYPQVNYCSFYLQN